MYNKTKINLNEKISATSKFVDINQLSDFLLEEIQTDEIPVSLLPYFKHRHIRKIEVDPKISHEAYIEVFKDYFVLHLKKEPDLKNAKDRFLIAHEVAHTFQFDIKSNTIVDLFFFANGSTEQEFFCDFFARAILVPTKHLLQQINEIDSQLNHLTTFYYLCRHFNVPYNQLFYRIFNDLSIVQNKVLLRFGKFYNNTWKLYESFATEDIRHDKKYYIPSRNYDIAIPFIERLPSCGPNISAFLDDCLAHYKVGLEYPITLSKELLSDKPLTSLLLNTNSNLFEATFTISQDTTYYSYFLNLYFQIKKSAAS